MILRDYDAQTSATDIQCRPIASKEKNCALLTRYWEWSWSLAKEEFGKRY